MRVYVEDKLNTMIPNSVFVEAKLNAMIPNSSTSNKSFFPLP